jgi:hypothetical protein
VALSSISVVAAPAAADVGTVYGAVEVRDAAGDIVTDARVELTALFGGESGSMRTGVDGIAELSTDWESFNELAVPPPGTILDATLSVSALDLTAGFEDFTFRTYWWNGSGLGPEGVIETEPLQFAVDSAEVLVLTLGVELPDGVIEGTVDTSVPVSGEAPRYFISFSDYSGGWTSATAAVDETGFFRVTGLPGRSYRMQASVEAAAAGQHLYGFASTWYPGTPFESAASEIILPAGETLTNIDIELLPNALIRGVIERDIDGVLVPATENNATRHPGISIFPVGSNPNALDAITQPTSTYFGERDGRYDLPVHPGTYLLAFGSLSSGAGGPFIPYQYWDGATEQQDAVPMELAPGVAYERNALYPEFFDVSLANQFIAEITWLAVRGVSRGYDDGSFRPIAPVGRDAMAAFLYRFAGEPAFTPPLTPSFSDVPRSNQFYKEIEWLRSTGITTGFPDGTYRPLGTVARDAMAAFLYRAAGEPSYTPPPVSPFIDVPTTSQFYKEVAWLAEQGISTGFPDSTFRSLASVNRDAMAAFLFRYGALLLAVPD